MRNKTKRRRIKAWVAVSPICEGANIYMPGGGFDVWECIGDATAHGWRKDELVEATITYKKKEPK